MTATLYYTSFLAAILLVKKIRGRFKNSKLSPLSILRGGNDYSDLVLNKKLILLYKLHFTRFTGCFSLRLKDAL
jgi:hypothetical protein